MNISGDQQAAPAYCIEILGKYTRPVSVSYHGRMEEIAIVFTPLGVNRFIDGDFITVAPQYAQPFTKRRWLEITPALFASDDPISELEAFLLSVISDRRDLIPIEKALRLLEDNLSDYSMTDIAEQTDMGFKTFQRHFTKALACSPTEYKRIARFRSALRSKLYAKKLKSLTSISYENNYSDQSYFIREFRKLTSQNPKNFFREVRLVDGEKIAWEIL